MNQSLPNFNHCRLSVIIPSYNRAVFLPEAIESVLSQTYPVFEIIVVDDGSTDETKACCDRYPTVQYIYQSNQGVSAARNTGMRVSKGEYLLFFDSDDRLLPKAVEIGVNCINAHPEVGFVFGNYIFQSINPDGSYKTEEIYDNQPEVADYATILAAEHKIQCACIIFRRVAIESVGGFDPNLAAMEDINLFLRVAREFPIYFHNQIVFEYRYHGSNLSTKSAEMLISALHSHSLQWSYIEQTLNKEYEAAYERGKQAWITLFGRRLPYAIMGYIKAGQWVAALGTLRLILNYDPKLRCIDREVYEVSYKALLSQLQELPIQSSLAYWKQQLAGAPPLLSLPTDRPRPAEQNGRGSSQSFVVSQELTEALSLLSRQEGVTLFMTLLAAFNTLLYRYTSTEDIVVGSPIASRVNSEIFVNAVALRTDMSGNPRFQELLERVRKVALLAQNHQDLPFEMLVEELQPQRDLSYSPLFQVMFVMEGDVSLQKIEVSSLTASPWVVEDTRAKFDLTLFLEQTSNGLVGKWVYNTDLFDADTIERMNGHFQTMLVGIVAQPQQPISELPLLTAKERQQYLEWNNTQTDYPLDKCIHQLFEEQVKRTPDAVAVVFEQQQLTYWELNSRANQLAHYLRTLGIGSDVLVGICIERSLEMVVGLLGILKAGGAYVPLDARLPQERLTFMLEDAQISVLLTEQSLLESDSIQGIAQTICLDTDWEIIAQQSESNPAPGVVADNLAYVIYTSGSTGKPKGVMLSHRSLCNHMCWMQATFPLTEKDKVLQKTPFSFDASVWEFYAPLLAGAQLLVAKPGGHQDSAYLLKLIAEKKVTTVQLVPSLLQMLLEQGGIETCDSLKHVFCGGEALPVTLVEGLLTNLNVNLHNLYGPTEACIDATAWTCKRRIDGLVPIGRPISNTQIYILDPHGQPVPIGVRGELHIGGAGLARGYFNRPELTALKFIPNPFSNEPSSRLYKTGDVARYLPNGDIEYISRIDNQVKIRGFRIELLEIEVLLAKHPEIREIAVIVREDVPGDKRLVAYIVPNQDQIPTVKDLRDFLSQQLPNYMIPSAFVTLDALPLTPSGKVDRRTLLAYNLPSNFVSLGTTPQADNGIVDSRVLPNTSRIILDTGFDAKRNPTEEILVAIWAEVLGLKQIGIHDNFFELGGHSLLAMRLFNEIEKTLGTRLSLATLFQKQTIAELATILHQEESSQEWESLVMIQQGKPTKPPLFCIHAIWGNVLFYRKLAHYLLPDQPFYGLQAQGLDGKRSPLTSIPEMASQYIKEMQRIQPLGPYFLGGFSLGGQIAFEVARQLHALGQEVRLLAVFDCGAPVVTQYSVDATNTKPKTLWELSFSHLNNLLNLKPQDKKNYLWERINWHLRAGKASIFYKSYLRYIKRSFINLRILDVAAANHQAFRSYVPQEIYPGKVTLFLSASSLQKLEDDPKLWDKAATGGVEIYQIPGAIHTTLMEEPSVRLLAEKLTVCLQQVQADSSLSVS